MGHIICFADYKSKNIEQYVIFSVNFTSIKRICNNELSLILYVAGSSDHADFRANEEPVAAPANRRAARRKEPRRHTLANGIDFNMVSLPGRNG